MIGTELRYLNKDHIKQLNLSLENIIDMVEKTFVAHALEKVHLPAKVGIHPNHSSFFHAMPAMVTVPKSAGIKWVSYFPTNKEEKNLSDSSCLMILNDPETGLPTCIMDALEITYMRTAASGAIAAKRLAAPDAQVLGIVGAGTIARWAVHAILKVLPSISEIRVISRTEKSRDRFCAEMGEIYQSVQFIPYNDLESLIRESDIALSITSNSGKPFIDFGWVKKGGLALPLDGIKSWDISFLEADTIVTDDKEFLEREIKRKHGVLNLNCHIDEIGNLIQSEHIQWSKDKKVIAFMNGVGSTDVVIGQYIYEQAVEKNLGMSLPL